MNASMSCKYLGAESAACARMTLFLVFEAVVYSKGSGWKTLIDNGQRRQWLRGASTMMR